MTTRMERNMNSVRATGIVRGAACLIAYAFASHSALAGPGDLDASFGNNGFAAPTLTGPTFIGGAALQRDGKIVIVGAEVSPAAGNLNRNAIVIRLNPNGSLDTSFSGDGIAIVDSGAQDSAYAVLITADDKILIAGYRYGALPGPAPTLARLNSDGSLDPTFAQFGIASYPSFSDVSISSLVELSDGRFVAGGYKDGANRDFAIFAVGSNGALDTTFGTNGRQVVDFAGAEDGIVDMRRLPGDRVIAVGETNDDGVQSIGLMLVNSAGQLDTSFGPAAGFFRIGEWDSVQDIELQSDGKLLIAGGRLGYNFPVMGMVVRLNPDGAIDRSFGSEGRILRGEEVQQVVSDASGRIYFAGVLTSIPMPAPYDGRRRGYVEAVERDGAPARTFAASGGTTIDVGRGATASDFTTVALLRQADGRLVVVGQRGNSELIVVGIAAGGEHGGVISMSRPADAPSGVSETVPSVSFLVERTGGSNGTVSVSYAAESSVAVAGQDFVATSGTLTWGDGETATKTITLPLIDDNDFEPENPQEPITVRIFDPTGGASISTSSAGVSVLSDEKTTQVNLYGARVSESAGPLNVMAQRVGDARVRAVVQYSVTADSINAEPNVDFIPVSGTLTWEPFDMSPRIIAIPILDDAIPENSEEQVRIQLSSTSPGVTAYSSVTGSIVDDDGSSPNTPYMNLAAVSEGAGSLTVTFGRHGNINVPITATLSIIDPAGSNVTGPDHGVPNITQVSWAANELTSRTITIPIIDDAVAEGPEQFSVLIEAPGEGSNTVHFFTILDDDADVSAPSQLGFAQSEMNVAESVGTVSVTVNRSGAAAFPVSATVTVSGSDIVPSLNFPLSWAGGDSAPKTIVVPIVNDTTPEPRRAITVGLKDVYGGARVGPIVSTRINVEDDDGFTNTVGFAQDEILISEDADYVDLPITTTDPLNNYGAAMRFAIRSGGTAEAGREFVLPRMQYPQPLWQNVANSLRIYLNGDQQFEDEETFIVDMVTAPESMPVGRGSITVRLTSDDSLSAGAPMQVGFVTTAITEREDQSVVNVTVRRIGAADSAVAVSYETAAGSATAGSDFVAATGQLQWAAGDMADKTVAVVLTNDATVESTETMTLRLFAPTNGATLAEGTATISITDDDSGAPPSNNGGPGGSGGGGGKGGGGGSMDLSMLFALLLLGWLQVSSPDRRAAAALRRRCG